MARKPKTQKSSKPQDRAQEKARKQKRLAAILGAVLVLVCIYEVPHTMKLMNHSAKAPVVETSASAPAAPNPTTTTPSLPAAAQQESPPATSAPTSNLVASVQVTPDQGQLTEFARFASKDPFDPQIQNTSGGSSTAGGASTPSTPASPAKKKPAATPKTPPAPPPTSAYISVNGEWSNVAPGADFPVTGTVFSRAGSVFHLVSLTGKTAKVAIAGGSYADGAPAITLTVGVPLTLQNTADGTRYTLVLEPQGAQPPVTTTTSGQTSTTPATTTPVVPTSPSG